MSLSKKIAAEVDDLVKTSAPAICLTAVEGPHKIDLAVTQATSIGIDCRGFDFQVDHRPMAIDDLKAWGNRIAKKVTYLLEPLAIHEADTQSNEVVLRSAAPSSKPDRRSFYEIRLKSTGTLKFDRVAYFEQARNRQPVSCQFTNEVVERLVDDLVATAP